jgi:Flp pilus assembly protein TadG
LLLPIVLVVLLAVVQVGVFARDRLVVSQAARAGARAAAVEASDAAVTDAVHAAAPQLDPAAMTITIERVGTRGAPVTVRVSYAATTAGLLAGWLMPATVALAADATMRQEFG